MNSFQAECFLALSKSLNFTQTAEELYISQPTLSRNIAALEQEVGVQLLVRNSKSVELTAAGKRFAEGCSVFIERYNWAIEETRLAQEGVLGSLRIGIQQDAFEPFTVDLINRFRKEHPKIQLKISPMSLSDLVRRLNSGRLDFVIAAGETNLQHPGRLLLSERNDCAVLPKDHPLANRGSLRMEDLRKESFVCMSPIVSASGHYQLLHYAKEAGFSPNIVAMANSVPAMMMLIACGVGIGVLYKDLAVYAYDRLTFIPLEGIETFKRYLLWDEDSENPAIQTFLRCAHGGLSPHSA